MANVLNESVIKGKWNELKGRLQKTWGNLTNDEIDQAQGDLKKFYGSVQQKYGQTQEEVRHKLNSMIYPEDRIENDRPEADLRRREDVTPRPL